MHEVLQILFLRDVFRIFCAFHSHSISQLRLVMAHSSVVPWGCHLGECRTWQLLQLCSQPKPPSCILCGVGVAQSYPTRCDPMDRTPPGSSVHGIPQARILEWVAMPFSRGSSRPRDRTPGLRHYRETFYHLSHQGSSCTLYPMTLIYSLML